MFTPPYQARPKSYGEELLVRIGEHIRNGEDAHATLMEIAGVLDIYDLYLQEQSSVQNQS
jgi:hypothetical protein